MPAEVGGVRPARTFRAAEEERLQRFYTGGPAALTADGSLLAAACADEVKVVDFASGAVERTLAGDSEPITSLVVTPDGLHLFAASRSLLCKKWSLATGEALQSWKGHSAPVWDMCVDATGALLATASADRTLRIWDVDKGFCTHVFRGHRAIVLVCAFNHDRHRLQLYSGAADGEVRLWDLVTNACLAVHKEHFSAVTSLSVSPCGWLLLSGARDKMVMVWDLRNHKKVAGVPVFEAVEGMMALPEDLGLPGLPPALSPTWKTLRKNKTVFFCTVGEKGAVKFWSSASGAAVYSVMASEVLPALTDGTDSASRQLTSVELLPRVLGCGFLVCSADARLMVFSPAVTQAPNSMESGGLVMTRQLVGNNDEVTDLRLLSLPDGDATTAATHVALASNAESIRVFRLSDRSCVASLEGHSETVLCLDAVQLQEGSHVLLASGSKDNSVRLWGGSLGSWCNLAVGQGHIGAVSAVAFGTCMGAGGKGRVLVSGGADKLIKVWDVSPFLAVASDPAKRDVASLHATAAVAAHDKDINAVALSPDDNLLVTASADRTARLWRMPNLLPMLTLKGHKRGVWAAAFSPVDKVVATASGDRTLRLWAIADGSCLKTFEGHGASVLRVCFLSAGTQLMSSGADGLLKLWSVRTTECVNTFDEHEDRVWALTKAPGSDALFASGGGDAVVNIWRDSTASDAAEEEKALQESLLRTQDLENALMYEEYGEAARLAFRLGHPGKLLRVVNAILDDAAGEGSGKDGAAAWQSQLGRLVADFSAEEIRKALEYSQEWNTKARSCMPAQAMVGAILANHQHRDLLKVPGIGELLEGLTAYSGRHFRRLTQLMRSTFLLDYMLTGMKSVLPDDGDASEGEDGETCQLAMLRDAGREGTETGAVLTSNGAQHHEPAMEEEVERPATLHEEESEEVTEVALEQTPRKKDKKGGSKRRHSTGAELTPSNVGKLSTKKAKEGRGSKTAVKTKRAKV